MVLEISELSQILVLPEMILSQRWNLPPLCFICQICCYPIIQQLGLHWQFFISFCFSFQVYMEFRGVELSSVSKLFMYFITVHKSKNGCIHFNIKFNIKFAQIILLLKQWEQRNIIVLTWQRNTLIKDKLISQLDINNLPRLVT